jgi:hypothetical protein
MLSDPHPHTSVDDAACGWRLGLRQIKNANLRYRKPEIARESRTRPSSPRGKAELFGVEVKMQGRVGIDVCKGHDRGEERVPAVWKGHLQGQ